MKRLVRRRNAKQVVKSAASGRVVVADLAARELGRRSGLGVAAMDADARDTPSPPAGGACGASVSFAPEDSSRKLLELERTLAAKDAIMAVSYTHLTLPTIYSV